MSVVKVKNNRLDGVFEYYRVENDGKKIAISGCMFFLLHP